MFKWNNISGSLLIRSVYLITIPIVLIQIIGIVIFFELHWDLVLKRSAQSIANEIKILEMNKQLESINNYANTLEIIRVKEFEIDKTKKIKNWIFKKRITQSLGSVPGNFIARQNNSFFIFYDKNLTQYFYLIPKKRVETKTVGGFFLWTIAISILLSLISYFFIKKQIQPLKRLGIITRSFGRGIEIPILKPTGSSEVRGLISDFNNMQNNINSTIDNQRNMLAGISHDLKTPLTRINLMIEEMDNSDLQMSISKNISEMNLMLNHYLDFIKNEKNENFEEIDTQNFIKDLTLGTIAMARTSSPNSATSQFFINLRDNEFLDKANSADGYGYCVFGQVTDGIEIVEQIGAVSTGNNAGHSDVPIENIIINEVTLIE